MADTATQPITCTRQQGEDFLMHEILIPNFFSKLASHGLQPTDEAEANVYLDMGFKLFNEHLREQTKTASSRLDFLKQASSKLDEVITQRGGQPLAQQKIAADASIAQAAASLAQHPSVRAAVLALQS
jgi:hypothetical protein